MREPSNFQSYSASSSTRSHISSNLTVFLFLFDTLEQEAAMPVFHLSGLHAILGSVTALLGAFILFFRFLVCFSTLSMTGLCQTIPELHFEGLRLLHIPQMSKWLAQQLNPLLSRLHAQIITAKRRIISTSVFLTGKF